MGMRFMDQLPKKSVVRALQKFPTVEPRGAGVVALTGQIAAPEAHDLISPEELATLVGGAWTGGIPRAIRYIREDLDNTEDGLRDFLYAPELFFRQGSTLARAALLSAPQAVERGAVGCLVSERPRN